MEEARRREVLEVEAAITKAFESMDYDFIERVWHDDFFYTGIRGELKTKRIIIDEMKSSTRGYGELSFHHQRVTLLGESAETAIVTGEARTNGKSPEGPIVGRFRYTRVYTFQGGSWRVLFFQGTAMAEK